MFPLTVLDRARAEKNITAVIDWAELAEAILMKKALREMQTLRAGCSNAELQIFAPHRPPSQGHRTAKIESAGDGHYLHLQTQFGEDRNRNSQNKTAKTAKNNVTEIAIPSYRGNSPTNKQTNKHINRQD